MTLYVDLQNPARSAVCKPLAALGLACLLALALLPRAWAAEPHGAAAHGKDAKETPDTAASDAKIIGAQVREAVKSGDASKKRLNLIIDSKETVLPRTPAKSAAAPEEPAPPAVVGNPRTAIYLRPRPAPKPAPAAAPAHEIHWSYEGEGGPQNWGQLKPEYKTCAIGKRQSPIHIEDSITLQGPAEPIQFNYTIGSGTVINNGHTIQVDVYGDNTITVRGSTYKLLQFHFHHPSEERINYKSYAMVAHLVHRNADGQLAVVGVLMESGEPNELIKNVWTYMPLDAGDKVRMPDDTVDMNQLLPQDQRYYQFLGSLTTPPCTEGVLWMVLKRPMTLSREQLKLFGQLYPNNARPVQAVNNRPIRDAK